VKDVHTEILNKEINKLIKNVEAAYKILDKANDGGASFEQTPEGLRQLLESTVPGTVYGRNPRYQKNVDGTYLGDGRKISGALKDIEQINNYQDKLRDLD
jgi:hypothetical protein